MWQYLAVIPYGTLDQDMVWKIYYFLHFIQDQEAEDEATLENLHALSKTIQWDSKYSGDLKTGHSKSGIIRKMDIFSGF